MTTDKIPLITVLAIVRTVEPAFITKPVMPVKSTADLETIANKNTAKQINRTFFINIIGFLAFNCFLDQAFSSSFQSFSRFQ